MHALRTLASALAVGSLVAFFVGLANLGDAIQVGGADGMVFDASDAVLVAIVLGVGSALSVLGIDDRAVGHPSPRLAIGVGLMTVSGLMFVALGQFPEELDSDGPIDSLQRPLSTTVIVPTTQRPVVVGWKAGSCVSINLDLVRPVPCTDPSANGSIIAVESTPDLCPFPSSSYVEFSSFRFACIEE